MEASAVVPCVVTGALWAGANSGAIDVSHQRLVAFGAGSVVSIVDPDKMAVVQTLDGHTGAVSCVRWNTRALDTNLDAEYRLTLASGDDKGIVMVWSVLEGSADLQLVDAPASQVVDLAWHPRTHQLLLTLRHPNVLALWDTAKGTLVWRKAFAKAEDVVCAAFNPYPLGLPLYDVFFASRKGVVFHMPDVADPNEVALKYRITSDGSKSVFRTMVFARAHPDCALFVLSRELLVLHVRTQYAVGGFSLERGMADLTSVACSASHAGVLWALHDDGRVSLWRTDGPNSLHFVHVASTSAARFAKVRRAEAAPMLSLACVDGTRALAVDRVGQLHAWHHDAVCGAQLRLASLVPSLMAGVTCVAMHPRLGGRQTACGTAAGTVLLLDLGARTVAGEYMIESGQGVRGARWLDHDTLLVYTVHELQADAVWSNAVLRLDVRTGRVAPLMTTKKAEPTFIRTLKLSPSRRHMLILRRDRPLELWDVGGPTVAHLGNVKPFIQMSTVAWRTPVGPAGPGAGEEFCAATLDNMLRFFRVEGGKLAVVRQQESITMSPVGAVAWRGDLVAAGDAAGNLTCYDWGRKVCWTIATRGGAIQKLRWGPHDNAPLLLVVFASGAIAQYDMATKRVAVESKLLAVRGLRVLDACWGDDGRTAVVTTADGCVRVLDADSWSVTAAPLQCPAGPLSTPYALPARVALALRVALLRGGQPLSDGAITEALLNLPSALLAAVQGAASHAERALAVARWFGDAVERDLWELVLSRHAPRAESLLSFDTPTADMSQEPAAAAAAVPAAEASAGPADRPWTFCRATVPAAEPAGVLELPPRFGLLRPSVAVHVAHVAHTAVMEARRSPSDAQALHVCADRFLLHGDKPNAIRVLLESDPAGDRYMADALMACVVSASLGPEYYERTIKMVAANLIVRGDVDAGVQLLLLVGRADEACRHLQDAKRWEDAAQLAKLRLAPAAQRDVLLRWAGALTACGDARGLMLLVALQQRARVLAQLHAEQQFQLALALDQYWTVDGGGGGGAGHEGGDVAVASHVLDSLHLDAGFYLHRLGLDAEAAEQWARAGPAGAQMLETISAPNAMPPRARTPTGSAGTIVVTGAPASKFDKLFKVPNTK